MLCKKINNANQFFKVSSHKRRGDMTFRDVTSTKKMSSHSVN